jgi:hypothetical protein
MMSVTQWIQINAGETQTQNISCANNSTPGGLSYSLWDNSPFNNQGPWMTTTASGYAWWTGGVANLTVSYPGFNSLQDSANYQTTGLTVTNWGGNGNWQLAIPCYNAYLNSALVKKSTELQNAQTLINNVATPAVARDITNLTHPRTEIITADHIDGKYRYALLAREYPLEKGKLVKDIRECPAGMKVVGKPTWTIGVFTADHQAPKWADRSIVKVQHKNVGTTKIAHAMRVTRAKNPTVVQFQIHCAP